MDIWIVYHKHPFVPFEQLVGADTHLLAGRHFYRVQLIFEAHRSYEWSF